MIEENFHFKWYCTSRAAGLSEKSVSLMAEAGCQAVFIGVESGDPDVLTNMDKKIKISDAYKQMEWFHKYGICIYGSFVTGFPGETDDAPFEVVYSQDFKKYDSFFLAGR